MIVFLTQDLMIQSSANAAARAKDLTVVATSSVENAINKLSCESVAAFFVDLQTPGLNVSSLVCELEQLENSPYTVAFAQHVEEEILASAELANSDSIQSVLTRGQFSRQLPTLIAGIVERRAES